MEKKVQLELTIEQLNIVLIGLTKLTIETGLSTFNEIQKQADAQLRPIKQEGPLANKIID